MKTTLRIETADGRTLKWVFHRPEKLKAAKKDREVIVFAEAGFLQGTPRVIGQQLWLTGQEGTYVMDLAKVIGWIYAPKFKNM